MVVVKGEREIRIRLWSREGDWTVGVIQCRKVD